MLLMAAAMSMLLKDEAFVLSSPIRRSLLSLLLAMLTRRQSLRCSVPATSLRREIRQEMFDIMITVMSLTLIALNNRNGCEVQSRLLEGTIAIVG